MGTPILHAQGRTTPWAQCTGVTVLSAGTIWWRWYGGRPELQLRGAEWLQQTTIPWVQLAPAPVPPATWDRWRYQLPHHSNIFDANEVVLWNGGLSLLGTPTRSSSGIVPYSV